MKTDFFRGRRLRRSPGLRAMVRETRLAPEDLIMPYFVVDTPDVNFCKEITSMPGQHQLSLARLEARVGAAVEHGLRALMLFGILSAKGFFFFFKKKNVSSKPPQLAKFKVPHGICVQ